MARISTGKRLRFRVFERDGFTCQYCGKKPPEVILHADHVFPVSKGGTNEIENLITACADCNLGKATMELGKGTPQTYKNAEDLQERFDQLKAFYKLQKKISQFKEEIVDDIAFYWEDQFQGSILSDVGRTSIKSLMDTFTPEEIKDAMSITRARGIRDTGKDNRYRYMCGVLHTKRKQQLKDRLV